jgi:MgsA AAA+ ATPase C terminal
VRITIPDEYEHPFELRALLFEHSECAEPVRPQAITPPDQKWLVSSAMQKSIRRGGVDAAVRYALALHALDPRNFWHRLQVIALEDIGLANLLHAAMVIEGARSARFRQQLGELRALAACVTVLASSVKNRSIIDHACSGRSPSPTISGPRIGEPSRFQAADSPFLLRYLASAGRWMEGLGDHLIPAYELLKDAEVQVGRQAPDPDGDEMVGQYPACAVDWHTREGRRVMIVFAKLPPIAEFFAEHPDLDRQQALYLAIWSEESVKVDRCLTGLEIAALELEGVLNDWRKIGVTDSRIAVRLKALVREHRAQLNWCRARVLAHG